MWLLDIAGLKGTLGACLTTRHNCKPPHPAIIPLPKLALLSTCNDQILRHLLQHFSSNKLSPDQIVKTLCPGNDEAAVTLGTAQQMRNGKRSRVASRCALAWEDLPTLFLNSFVVFTTHVDAETLAKPCSMQMTLYDTVRHACTQQPRHGRTQEKDNTDLESINLRSRGPWLGHLSNKEKQKCAKCAQKTVAQTAYLQNRKTATLAGKVSGRDGLASITFATAKVRRMWRSLLFL